MKKELNLRNFQGLINYNLLPQSLEKQKKAFQFNKYLKGNKSDDKYLFSGNEAVSLLTEVFEYPEFYDNYVIAKDWDKFYTKIMTVAKDYIKQHQTELLDKYNEIILKEIWDKYASGTISAWEMDSVCFYWHEHELAHINNEKYGIKNFSQLQSNPVEYYYRNNFPIFKLSKIAGTVIAKNDVRASVSLLTTDGVVNVKFPKEYFAIYKARVSQKQEDGTNKVIENSWFTKGVKLLVTGYRRDDTFISKTYKRTQSHQLYRITEIKENGDIVLVHEREQI